MGNKKQLGKGIRALLSDIETGGKQKEKAIKSLSGSVNFIKLKNIQTNPDQPRKDFDKNELSDLSDSIKVHGLIQPLVVRVLSKDKYQLISGERRYKASKMAGLKEVPVFIRTANDQELLEMALVENIQRQDLNAIEIALSFQRLMDECDLTHDQLSKRIAKNRSTISNYTRLLKLPIKAQKAVRNNDISMGHAKVIAGLKGIDKQLNLLNRILSNNMSVRATEQFVKPSSGVKTSKKQSNKSNALIAVQDQLSAFFGTRVDLSQTSSGSGKISIPFNSTDQLNDILDRIE